MLFRRGEARKQRQYFHGARRAGPAPGAHIPGPEFIIESLRGIPNLALPGEEDQNISLAFRHEFLGGRHDSTHLIECRGPARGARRGHALRTGVVVLLLVFRVLFLIEGAIPDLHRIGAPGHLDDRRGVAGAAARAVFTKMRGETFGVNGGGGDNDFEVGARGQQAGEVAEDEVDIEGAFVRFVDDEGVVAQQVRIGLDFREEDAVRHEFDEGGGAHFFGETNLIADGAANFLPQFGRDAFGNRAGRDAPRLGVPDEPGDAPAQLQADFRQLGSFPGAGFPGNNDHLIRGDGFADFRAPGGNGQSFRVGNPRNGRLAGF